MLVLIKDKDNIFDEDNCKGTFGDFETSKVIVLFIFSTAAKKKRPQR